jgi:hypothetical protein
MNLKITGIKMQKTHHGNKSAFKIVSMEGKKFIYKASVLSHYDIKKLKKK